LEATGDRRLGAAVALELVGGSWEALVLGALASVVGASVDGASVDGAWEALVWAPAVEDL